MCSKIPFVKYYWLKKREMKKIECLCFSSMFKYLFTSTLYIHRQKSNLKKVLVSRRLCNIPSRHNLVRVYISRYFHKKLLYGLQLRSSTDFKSSYVQSMYIQNKNSYFYIEEWTLNVSMSISSVE